MSVHHRVFAALVVGFITIFLVSGSVHAVSPCLSTDDGRCLPAPYRVSGSPPAPPHTRQSAKQGPAVLVKRRKGITAADFKTRLQALGYRGAVGLVVKRWWKVPVPVGQNADQVMSRLARMPEAEVVEKDRTLHATYLPDDTYFAYQWGMQTIQAPAAWDEGSGSPNVWIAVVDTGIDYDHPDRPVYLINGYNFVDGNTDPYDDNGHGTHVAGIAAADTNNGIGVAGLCYDCEVLAVKVADSNGNATNSNLADGIEYAAYWGQQYGASTVINLSLGSPAYSSIIAQAVSDAQAMGDLVVAASGNSGPGLPGYPAALPDVVSVSATDSSDIPASFSQYGDIAAPGVSIMSTVPTWYLYPPYTIMNGTSMASPHVAGAAGLVWSLFPACSGNQIASELLNTVDIPTGWDGNYGWGRLNVNNAILRFTTNALPAGNTGNDYSQTIDTFGGTALTTFTISSGALPPGLSMTSWGLIYGSPTQPGTYSFNIHVADGGCEAINQLFSISVQGLPIPTATSVPTITPMPTLTPTPASYSYLPFVSR